MSCSLNFLSKKEFVKAVRSGVPVVLYNEIEGFPVINGTARVAGPWPNTPPPVEELVVHLPGGRKLVKQRQRLLSWHADVVVKDMRIVEVVH